LLQTGQLFVSSCVMYNEAFQVSILYQNIRRAARLKA
jgi:hypothetical protein